MTAISEPTAVKLGLSLDDKLELDALKSELTIGAIFHDYGSPNGEVLISPELWQEEGFTNLPTSLGIEVSGDKDAMYQTLLDELSLNPNQLYDQADIKEIALNIFSQTFAITRA